MFLYINFTVENFGCRTGHVDMVIVGPFDVESTSVHYDGALSSTPVGKCRSDSRGAGSRATGHGNARTSFPYSHADFVVRQDLGEFHIHAVGEQRMMFQYRSHFFKFDLIDVIDKITRCGLPIDTAIPLSNA